MLEKAAYTRSVRSHRLVALGLIHVVRECSRRPRGGALGAGTVEREERVTRVVREERNFPQDLSATSVCQGE